MESQDPTDRLQDYLDGVVSGAEEHVLESRLKNDPLFAERLLQLATEEAVLKEWAGTAAVALRTTEDAGPLPENWNAAVPDVPNMDAPRVADTKPRRKLGRRLTIAGVGLVGVALLGAIGHLVEPRALPALKELFFPSPPPAQGDPIATLDNVFGDATYSTRWDEDFKARGGTALFAYEKIQTGPLSGLATIRYPDGTSLELSTDTTVQLLLDDEPNSKHIDLKEGFLTVDVPRPGDGRLLIVSTPHAEMRILTAHFTCSCTAQTTTVETEDGSVEMVRLLGGRPVAGQTLKVEGGFYAVAAKDAEALVAHKVEALQIKQPRKVITDPAGPILALAYAPDGKWFASGGWDGTVNIWGPTTGESMGSLRGQKTPVRCLAFFPKELLASGGDRRVRIWEIDREQVFRIIDQESEVNELTVSPDGKWVATAMVPRENISVVKLWEWQNGLGEVRSMQRNAQTAPCLAFSPDSKMLATGYEDGRIVIWSVPECTKLTTFNAHASHILALRWSAKGDRLASAGRDRTVKVWRWNGGKGEQVFKQERDFKSHGSQVRGVVFSPDGELLATGATDGTARLWDIASGREIATFLHRGYGVTAVTFTPDGKQLVSAGWDKAIKFWDLPEKPQE